MLVAERSHAALVPAGIAAGLAAGAAVLLQLSAATASAPEGIAEALWVLGWALAVWSAIAAVTSVVLLVRRREREFGASRASAVLVGTAVTVLGIAVWLHPFAGTGGGVG